MKKLIFSFLLLFGSLLFLNFGEVEASRPTFDLNIKIQYGNSSPTNANIPGVAYGQGINIDTGSLGEEGYEFLGYIVEGKVTQSIENSQMFRVTEDMDVVVHFKPTNLTAVVFMDSNHDLVDIKYTNAQGILVGIPNHASYSKPGLNAIGWNVPDIENHEFTEDTIVYLKYENNSTVKTLEYNSGSGLVTETKEYNSIVTLTANGTGDFSYWLKDGKIASLNPEYSFTMLDNHSVEAVYDDENFVANSDTLVYISDKLALREGYDTIVGQIHLAENEELVEWGIIASNIPGGITFDTPDVKVAKSTRYNDVSKEYMMSFDKNTHAFTNHRGFAKVINTVTEEIKTVYSYLQDAEPTYATDLIISEYGEGSSNNKWVEIYNGTGQPVSLIDYSLKINSNANTTWGNPIILDDVTINHGDTYVVANSGSVGSILSLANQTTGSLSHNGNDAIGLFKSGTLIDIFGVFGEDPGSGWTMADGNLTIDRTIIRNSNVVSPSSSWNINEWETYPKDNSDSTGLHSMTLPDGRIIILTNASTPQTLTVTGDSIVNANETIQLVSSVEDVIWVSSNPLVLTVDQTGLVTGVEEGTATVTAYSLYNHSVLFSKQITVDSMNYYDVTFNNEGVTSVVNLEGGTTVTEPVAPTKSGYVFEGWFVNLLDEAPFDFTSAIQSNLTLYAKWVEITDIVDFRTNQSGKYIEGIVTGINGGYIFVNDGTAAMAHHDKSYAIVNSINVGDKILFGGVSYSASNGLAQFGYSSHQVLSNNNTLPEALSLTSISEITEELQTQRISISGLTVSSFDGDNLFVSDGTNNIMIWSMTGSAVRQLIETVVVGQTLNLVNIHIGWYINSELTALNVEEIQLVELSDTMKVNEIITELTVVYSGQTYSSGGLIDLITESVRFGGNISWAASNPVINVSNGSIGTVESDTPVTLTAIIDVNGTTDTVTCEVIVLADTQGEVKEPITITLTENSIWTGKTGSYAEGNFEKDFSGMTIKSDDSGVYTGNTFGDNKIQVKKNYGWIYNTTIPEGYVIKQITVNGQTSGEVNIYFSNETTKPTTNGVLGVSTSGDVSVNNYKYFYIKENNTQSGTVTIDSIVIELVSK